ncbi:hypothetical protein ABPG72_001564 [Tetrahymena utriculariae]
MATQKDQKKDKKDIKIQNIEFVGIVREVHSGDSLTIQSTKTNNIARFFLTHVRAPKVGNNDTQDKPYAFESKEFLRKKLIGQQVEVKFEYEKTVKVAKSWEDENEATEKQMNFCTVFYQGQNINLLLIQEGYAEFNFARTEEEKSQYHDELKTASEEAAKKKKGVYSTKNIPLHRVNDISRLKNKPKLLEHFNSLKSKARLTGVVELVISGGIYKVRVNEEPYSILVLLSGVRCLPPDSNIPEYTTWSSKALDFAKNNLLQRDVEIQLERMDNKGKFHASILVNKQNYASQLLTQGLCFTFGKAKHSSEYEAIEKEVQAAKKGLFGSNKINIESLRTQNFDVAQKNVKVISGSVQAKLSELINTDEFFIQENSRIDVLDKMEKELDDFDLEAYPKLQQPVQPGTPCVALFSGDNNYYRGKIVKKRNDNKYEVFFIDYGFYDSVHIDDMCKLPEKWAPIQPFAIKLGLAYCAGLHDKHPLAVESDETFKELAWGKKVYLTYKYEDNGVKYVIVQDAANTPLNQTVNFQLLKKGLVRLDDGVSLPEELQAWQEEQDFAKEKKIGLWAYDEEENDD